MLGGACWFFYKFWKQIQWLIIDEINLGQTINPAGSTKNVQSINYSNDFEDIDKKWIKLQKLLKTGSTEVDL